MYRVLFSRIEQGIVHVEEQLKKIIPKGAKVLILPWAFPTELDANRLCNEFFKKGEKRYQRYIDSLKKVGILEQNIKIGNCYSDTSFELKQMIQESDILMLPGGNPEMFFQKVVHDTEILYDIKYYKGIILGESAGAELLLKRYFITKENNYYPYFAFYDGFGVLNDPFYFDVHSISSKDYFDVLQKVSDDTKKNVYAIFDDGVIIYQSTLQIELFGHVEFFCPNIDR